MKLLVLFCALVCCAVAAHDEKTCDEKPESGMCLAYFPKYYFDSETGTCKRFIYGGCQGNGNRYDSEEECLKNCGEQADVDDVCSLEAETGPCRAAFPRYFFNKKTGKCEEFIYGGCRGNANNFKSQEACESKCSTQQSQRVEEVCTLEHATGPCRAFMPRYYFDSKTGKCELFIYGGCSGNGNNFKTIEECHSTCAAQVGTQNSMMCKLESDSGPCKAFVTRYYYDYRTSQCKEFIYGGCKGNENNFLTMNDCQKACRTDTQRPSDLVCSLNQDPGPCKAFVPRYYYDSRTGQCKTFTYGGCQGNENNFLSESDCLAACSKDTRPPKSLVCNLEKDSGPCDAYIQRYYYDHLMRQCKQFVYGGCKGNENNFKTESECRTTCEGNGTLDPSLGTCNQSPDTGTCRGSFPRYFYNPRTRTCETFIYGGCGGNSNNFQTYQECINACSKRV